MKDIFVAIAILSLVACTSAPATPSEGMVQTAVAQTLAAQPAQVNTPVPKPSDTQPIPTNTQKPTHTPRPTNTPKPSSTPTPLPEPLNYSGKGDKVLDIDKWLGPAIIHLVYSGNRNFIVHSLDSNSELIDGLVNEIGQYDGLRPLDFFDNQHTTRLEIEATGEWSITIYPIATEYLHKLAVPGTYEGLGDDIILLTGATPDIGKFTYNGESNFIVHSYGDDFDGLINEIGAYQGEVVIPNGTHIIEVNTNASWTMEITSR